MLRMSFSKAAIESAETHLRASDPVVRRMIDEVGPVKTVVATGGVAPMIAEGSRFIEQTDLELTLKGLKAIYERNQTGKGRSR